MSVFKRIKRLTFLLFFLVSTIWMNAYSQPISNRSSDVITVQDGNLFAKHSFRPAVFVDTIAANLVTTLDSCGKLIFTYNNNSYWLRGCNPKRWIKVLNEGNEKNIMNASLEATGSYIQNFKGFSMSMDSLLQLNIISRGFNASGVVNRHQKTTLSFPTNTSFSSVFARYMRNVADNSDSIINIVALGSQDGLTIRSTNAGTGTESKIFLNQGVSVSTIDITADSSRIKPVLASNADSIAAYGPYNPNTGTRALYSIPKSAIGGNQTLQQVMDQYRVTNRTYIYDSAANATAGAPVGKVFMRVRPLDRNGTESPLLFSLGATAYTGVTQRDNVYHFGWNINSGGGQEVAGMPGIGESWEHWFIPTVGDTIDAEKHEFYITRTGVQKRLSSYTIRENIGSYDYYHTVSRFYIKRPSDNSRQWFLMQPHTKGAELNLMWRDNKLFKIDYDTTTGVTASIAGGVSGSAAMFTFSNFTQVVTPTFSMGSELIVGSGNHIRPAANNTTSNGDATRRWSNVFSELGNFNTLTINTALRYGAGTNFATSLAAFTNNQNGSTAVTIENPNTGTSAGAGLLISQNVNDYTYLFRYGSAFSGNYPNTSVPLASTTVIRGNASGNSAAYPVVFSVSNLIGMHSGSTGTTKGFRSDATGFRVDNINALHTTNTNAFQVNGSVRFDLGSDATGDTYTRSSGGAIARIGAGTAGQVFTANGAGTQPTWQNVSAALGYTSYIALLTQSGTGAPTATVLGNNGVGAIVWTRNGVGDYTGTLTGVFTANKTWLVAHGSDEAGNVISARLVRNNANTVGLTTRNAAGAAVEVFTNISIEIRIYP